MGIQMLSTLNQYIKTLSMRTEWDLKRESGDIAGHGKTLDQWLNHSAGSSREVAEDQGAGDGKLQSIQMKVYNGRALTLKEKAYLKEHDPETYEKARSLERQKRAYEEALKRCRTKEEVQRLKLAHLGASLSVVNAVKNDPHITKAKKLEILMLENGKMANLEKATQKFMESSAYKKLPGEREPGPDQIPVMEAAVEHLPKPDLERAAQLDIGKSEERVPYPAPNGSWTEPEETEAPERRTFWPARSRRRFEAKV